MIRLSLALAVLAVPVVASADDARIVEKFYDAGKVVRIDGRTKVQATIQFGEDEQIENVAIGDSQAWQVTPNKRANLLFVKPLAAAASTNMTVVTDKHTYLFDLVASASARPLYVLRFTYPQDEESSDAPPQLPTEGRLAQTSSDAANPYAIVDPAKLNFAWTSKGDRKLLPQRVYDDGISTYITWADGQPMPAILVRDGEGTEGPINFASRDNLIVIDGVPREIVLRLGKDAATLTFGRTRLAGVAGVVRAPSSSAAPQQPLLARTDTTPTGENR